MGHFVNLPAQRMSGPGRDRVKTHFARRVGPLTGEFDATSRLKLPLRG